MVIVRIDIFFGIVASFLTILLYPYCLLVPEKVSKGQCKLCDGREGRMCVWGGYEGCVCVFHVCSLNEK